MSKRVKVKDAVHSTVVWATVSVTFQVSDEELSEFRKDHPRATAMDYVRATKTAGDANYSQIDSLDSAVREEVEPAQYSRRAG